MTEKARQRQSKKRGFLKWVIPLVLTVIGLIVQFAVVPIFGLSESGNDISGKFWILAEDIPPLHLVYVDSEEGPAQSEYTPSLLYTLQIEQRLTFINPILWAPSKTYHSPDGDSEFVRVMDAEHIECTQLNKTAVTLRSPVRYLDKQTSSIQFMWQCSGCTADDVLLETQRYENVLRVELSNYYEYPVQYLGLVELPPLKTNILYMIEDSPPMLHPSESLVIWSKNNTKIDSTVDFPFIIELPEYTVATFDIEVSDEPPEISLTWQGYTALPVSKVSSPIVLVMIAVGVVVIIMVIILTFRRRRSRVQFQ